MPIAYEVASVFALEDRASSVINDIISRLEAMDTTIGRLEERFQTLGSSAGLSSLMETISRVDLAVSGLGDTALRTEQMFTASFSAVERGITSAVSQAERLTTALTQAAAASNQVARSSLGGGGGAFPRPQLAGESPVTGGGPFPRGGMLPSELEAARLSALGGGGGAFPRGGLLPSEIEAAQWERDFAEANYMNRDMDAAGRRGRGGGRGGGGGGLLHGMLPLAEAAGGYFAVRSSMREDLSIRQALLSMGYQPGTAEFGMAMDQMRATAGGATAGTIFSESQAAQMMPAAAGILGFGGSDPAARAGAMSRFSGIFPVAARLGEVAQMQKLGGLDDTVTAAIAYAHMTDRYDPEQLEPAFDRLLNLSRLTHTTVSGEESILKYSVPIGMAAGMKPDDVASLTGFMQVMGFSGTTAATGLGQLITGLTQTGGPLAAQHPHALRDMENALHLRTGTLRRGGRGNQHLEALEALGLIDPKTHQLAADVAPGGNLDAHALMSHITEYAQTHQHMQTLGVLRNAFTVRGMREAGVLESPDAIERLTRFEGQLDRLPGVRATQTAMADSPMQAFEQMLARSADLFKTLVDPTLPALQAAFVSLTHNIEGLTNWFKEHPQAQEAGGYAIEGLAGLALVGSARWALRGMRSLLGFGGGGAAAGEAAGGGAAGLGARAAGGLLAGTSGLMTLLSLVLKGDTPAGDPTAARAATAAYFNLWDPVTGMSSGEFAGAPQPPSTLHGKQVHDFAAAHWARRRNWDPPPPLAPYADESRSGFFRPSGAATGGAAPVTINIGPITLSGVADDLGGMVKQLFAKMASELAKSLTHDSGTGYGSYMAPVLSGGP